MNFGNYFLDLKKILDIESKSERKIIHNYYTEMMIAFQEGREGMGKSIMNTLINAGYLIDNRDDKIDKILDE
jgi:hypothetical protein